MAFLDETGLAELWSLVKENDVMASKKAFQVGDTLNTVRTDLGENWALCNGEVANASGFTEEIQNSLGIGWNRMNIANSYADGGNGYNMCRKWLVHGDEMIAYGADYSTRYPQIYISNKENPLDFEVVTIDSRTGYLAALAYGNGTWVAVSCDDPMRCTMYVYTATNLRGPWTKRQYLGVSPAARNICLAYGNGMWVTVYQNADGNNALTYRYATDPTGTWGTSFVNIDYQPKTLMYDNSGRWLLHYYYNNNAGIFYGTNPSAASSWKQVTAGNCYSYGLYYTGGYYVVCGRTEGNYYYPVIFYATDPIKTWTRVQLSYGTEAFATCIAYKNGQWAISGYNHSDGATMLFTAPSLGETWMADYVLDAKGSKVHGYVTDITYADSQCLLLGSYGTKGVVVADQTCKLPTISIDGVYTYIKVKEDE